MDHGGAPAAPTRMFSLCDVLDIGVLLSCVVNLPYLFCFYSVIIFPPASGLYRVLLVISVKKDGSVVISILFRSV